MKQLIYITLIVFGLVAVPSAPTEVTSVSAAASVTGAAEALFGAGAAVGPVAVDGLTLGTGVFIEPDGFAAGTFHAVLVGQSLLGRQEVTVEGKVNAGSGTPAGSATFSGTASVDLGDGTPALPGVIFSVTVTPDSLVLALGSTILPAAGVTTGTIIIE